MQVTITRIFSMFLEYKRNFCIVFDLIFQFCKSTATDENTVVFLEVKYLFVKLQNFVYSLRISSMYFASRNILRRSLCYSPSQLINRIMYLFIEHYQVYCTIPSNTNSVLNLVLLHGYYKYLVCNFVNELEHLYDLCQINAEIRCSIVECTLQRQLRVQIPELC